MLGVKEQIEFPPGHSFRVFKWENNLHDIQLVVASGQAVPIVGEGMHWHYHRALELTLFTRGEGTCFIGDQIQAFRGGDLVLLGENLPHYWHVRGASSGVAVQWLFPPEHAFWTFPETASLVRHFEAAGRGVRYRGRTAESLTRQLHQLTVTEGAERLGRLIQLLAQTATAPACEWEFISTQSFSLSGESRYQSAMSAAMRYLVANFREEVHLEELLKVTGMSKPTFSRQFKKHSGKTLSSFLQHVRIEAACRELAETDKPVIDVALETGFSQISFFNRVFARMRQCSPTQYRRQHARPRVA